MINPSLVNTIGSVRHTSVTAKIIVTEKEQLALTNNYLTNQCLERQILNLLH